MSVPLKIRKFGDGLGLLLSKELLAELNIGEGDVLMPVKTAYGFVLTPYDADFEALMEVNRDYMRRHTQALKDMG
jgi:putative addiction module antidote